MRLPESSTRKPVSMGWLQIQRASTVRPARNSPLKLKRDKTGAAMLQVPSKQAVEVTTVAALRAR
jgi:hypothetical protein